jgi:hypothetical protein
MQIVGIYCEITRTLTKFLVSTIKPNRDSVNFIVDCLKLRIVKPKLVEN